MKGLAIFVAGLLLGALAVAWVIWSPAAPLPTATRSQSAPAASADPPAVELARADETMIRPPEPPPPAERTAGAAIADTTASPIPTTALDLPPAPLPVVTPAAAERPAALLIPVAGVTREQLADTFSDGRGGERKHDAIDIMAAKGTPVLAVADGSVAKLFDSEAGGLTIYQFDASGNLAYYYAHLDRYAPGLAQGQAITRGQQIGYVGHSGNANPDAPHLHFAIFRLGPEKRWWQGEAINPYPLLRGD